MKLEIGCLWTASDCVRFGNHREAARVKSHHVHREYLRKFLEKGQLRTAGPFADDAGALWVLDAETQDEIEEIIKGDFYVAAGVIVSWKVFPFAYCSAQEAKGAK